jgi:sulfofructosephosphate aldolase
MPEDLEPGDRIAVAPRLSALARPGGSFAMLAIDQRESLRTLLVAAGGAGTDQDLRDFKVAVARSLSPAASGMLVDRDYGLAAVAESGALAPSCGLIVAVDRLIQPPGGVLEWSELDRAAMTEDLAEQGARALKFLVVWRPDQPVSRRADMVGDFVDRCRTLGLLSVLEGLVQVPGGGLGPDMDAAIQAAAEEFAPYRPDLYKTHVPTHGHGTAEEMTAASEQITRVLTCPWVVLSAAVPVDLFPQAVEAACKGGASGFLAGRGVWGPSVRAPQPEVDLATGARARFDRLVAVVDAHARPWPDVVVRRAAPT